MNVVLFPVFSLKRAGRSSRLSHKALKAPTSRRMLPDALRRFSFSSPLTTVSPGLSVDFSTIALKSISVSASERGSCSSAPERPSPPTGPRQIVQPAPTNSAGLNGVKRLIGIIRGSPTMTRAPFRRKVVNCRPASTISRMTRSWSPAPSKSILSQSVLVASAAIIAWDWSREICPICRISFGVSARFWSCVMQDLNERSAVFLPQNIKAVFIATIFYGKSRKHKLTKYHVPSDYPLITRLFCVKVNSAEKPDL